MRILFLANSVKSPICHVKSMQLGHNLLTSVNDRVILLFAYAMFLENITLTKISEFTGFQYRKDLYRQAK